MANSYCLEGKENQSSPSYTLKGKKKPLLDFPSFSNKKTVLDCATEERASKWEIELQRVVLNLLFTQAIHVERFPLKEPPGAMLRPTLLLVPPLKWQKKGKTKY